MIDKEQWIADIMYENEDLEYYEALEKWEMFLKSVDDELEDEL